MFGKLQPLLSDPSGDITSQRESIWSDSHYHYCCATTVPAKIQISSLVKVDSFIDALEWPCILSELTLPLPS